MRTVKKLRPRLEPSTASTESPIGRINSEPLSLKKFMDQVIKVSIIDYLPLMDSEEWNRLNEMWWNKNFDLPGPRALEPRNTPEAKFVRTLAWGNIEVLRSYYAISKARQYFSKVPRGLTNAKADYLAFIVHAYLNEIYILEQRMGLYLKQLTRASSKKSEVHKNLKRIGPELTELILASFGDVSNIRGEHVHRESFSDPGIERLSAFELMHKTGNQAQFFKPYRSEMKRVRKSFDERFESNEAALNTLMSPYYQKLSEAIFKTNGELRDFL